MIKQLEKEQETDEEIYDKMACWCETNEKEKTASIKKAEARIAQLEAKIEEDTALSAKLESEMRELEAEVAKNQEALDKATSIREKELAEFNGQEKELLEAVTALKSAVTVLEKHQGGAFLQMPGGSSAMNVAVTLQRLMMHHTDRLEGLLTHKERKAAAAFIQAPDAFVQADANPALASYAPQSGQIFGILSQMMEAFEKDLSEAQKQELANQKAYDELKAAKVEQIEAGQALIDKKSQEKAETDERLANSKVDLEETEESLAADEKFMVMLKEKCSMTDDEWEERQKTRAAEMEAVSKALAIISGDDAHDLSAHLQQGWRLLSPGAQLPEVCEPRAGVHPAERRCQASAQPVPCEAGSICEAGCVHQGQEGHRRHDCGAHRAAGGRGQAQGLLCGGA